jgi:hypothetical protein
MGGVTSRDHVVCAVWPTLNMTARVLARQQPANMNRVSSIFARPDLSTTEEPLIASAFDLNDRSHTPTLRQVYI